MKNLLIILSFTLAHFSNAQDINGVWADSSSSSFGNCYAIFSIDKDSVFMTHYIEFNGSPFVEHGSGIVKNGVLEYHVNVTKQIPGWTTTAGDHHLIVSADGKTLRGTYKDNVGNSGPLVFKRLFPKKE